MASQSIVAAAVLVLLGTTNVGAQGTCSVTPNSAGHVTISDAVSSNPYEMAYHIERTIGWRAGCHCTYPCHADHSDASLQIYWFSGCTALTSITIPSTIEVITECSFSATALTSLVMPDSIYYIGTQSFANNANLASVSLSRSLTEITQESFVNNTALTSILIPSATRDWTETQTFFPWGWIGESAFQGCTSLTTLTIENGTVFIDDDAFEGCIALNNVNLPPSVETLSEGSFANCTSLTTMIIQNQNLSAVASTPWQGLSIDAFNGSACAAGLYVHPGVVNCGAVTATAAPTQLPTEQPTRFPTARPTGVPTSPTASPTRSPTSFVAAGASAAADSSTAVSIGVVTAVLLLVLIVVIVRKRRALLSLLKSHNLIPSFFEDEADDPANFIPKLPKHIQVLVDMGDISTEQGHRVVAENLCGEVLDDDCGINALPALPLPLANLLDEGVISDYQANQIWTSVLPKHLKKLVDDGVLSPAQAHKIAINSDRQEHISNADSSKVLPPLPPYLIGEVRNGLMSRVEADATWEAELSDLIRADLSIRSAEAIAHDRLQVKLAQRKKWAKEGADDFGNRVDDGGDPVDSDGTEGGLFDDDDMDTQLPSYLAKLVEDGVISLGDAERAWLAELRRAELALDSAETDARNKLMARLRNRLGKLTSESGDGDDDGPLIPLPPDMASAVSDGRMTQEQAITKWETNMAAMIRSDLAVKAAETTARDRLRAKLAQRKNWAMGADGKLENTDGEPVDTEDFDDNLFADDDMDTQLPPHLAKLVADGAMSLKDAEGAWLAELRRAQLALDSAEENARIKLLARLQNRLGKLPIAVPSVSGGEDVKSNSSGIQPPLPPDLEEAVTSGQMTHEQAVAKWEADMAAMIRADLAVKAAEATARDRLRAKLALRKKWTFDTNGKRVSVQPEAHNHTNLPPQLVQLVTEGTMTAEDAETVWLTTLCRVDIAVNAAEAIARDQLIFKLQNRTPLLQRVSVPDCETEIQPPLPAYLAHAVDDGTLSQEQAKATWEADMVSLIRADLAARAAQATAQASCAARLAQRRDWDIAAGDVFRGGARASTLVVSADATDADTPGKLPTRLADFVEQGTMPQADAERAWLAELRRVDLAMNGAECAARDKLVAKLANRIESIDADVDDSGPTPKDTPSLEITAPDISPVDELPTSSALTDLPAPLAQLVARGGMSTIEAERAWLDQLTSVDDLQDSTDAELRKTLIATLLQRQDQEHTKQATNPKVLDPFRTDSLEGPRVPLTPQMEKLVRSGMLTRGQAQIAWDADLKNLIRADLSYRTAQSSAADKLRTRLAQRAALKVAEVKVAHTVITIDGSGDGISEGNPTDASENSSTLLVQAPSSPWKKVKQNVSIAPSWSNHVMAVVQPSILPPHLRGLVHSGVLTQEQALKTVHAELGRCEVAVSSAAALAQSTLQAKLAARMAMASHAHVTKAEDRVKSKRSIHQATSNLNAALSGVLQPQRNRRVQPVPAHPFGALPPLKGGAVRVTHAPPRYKGRADTKSSSVCSITSAK